MFSDQPVRGGHHGVDGTDRRPPGGFNNLGDLAEDRLVPHGLAGGWHGLFHVGEPPPGSSRPAEGIGPVIAFTSIQQC